MKAKRPKTTPTADGADCINPLQGMNCYDIVGARCVDCIYCGLADFGLHAGDCVCRYNPPTAGKGWPRLPSYMIGHCFCSCFTSAEIVQPLNPQTRVLPRLKRIGQF